jgi:hypothetical protein
MRIQIGSTSHSFRPRLDPPLLALLAAYITGTTEYLVGHPSGPSNPVNDWPRAHQALGSPSPLILTETAHLLCTAIPVPGHLFCRPFTRPSANWVWSVPLRQTGQVRSYITCLHFQLRLSSLPSGLPKGPSIIE